jgi:hypothetical protein
VVPSYDQLNLAAHMKWLHMANSTHAALTLTVWSQLLSQQWWLPDDLHRYTLPKRCSKSQKRVQRWAVGPSDASAASGALAALWSCCSCWNACRWSQPPDMLLANCACWLKDCCADCAHVIVWHRSKADVNFLSQ